MGVVALVSGGLDSLVLVQTLLRRRQTVFPLYLRCGLVWETVEVLWLKRWLVRSAHPSLRPLTILEMPLRSVYAGHWSLTGRGVPSDRSADAAVYLPGRNLILLSQAAIVAVGRRLSAVAIGTLAHNPFGDASPRFFRQLAVCLRQALAAPLQIVAPLRRATKAQLIAAWPTQPLQLTFSCVRPQGVRHCGRCNKCAERKRAFRQARVPDPTSYAN